MVGEPSTPKYLNWNKYSIQFSRKYQWTSIAIVEHYRHVLGLTIAGMTILKDLIDGGVGLNIIFVDTPKKIDLDFTSLLSPSDVPFYRIVPSAMSLGQIMLKVTFGNPNIFQIEFIKFKLSDFESASHVIFSRPTLAKFMVIPYYSYIYSR